MTDLAGELRLAAAAPPPKGWEPYAEESGLIGSAIVHLPRPGATERDLLIGAGFDPDEWRISGAINTRRWMRYDQEWLYYYKFDVVAGESSKVRAEHIEDIVKMIRKRSPRRSRIPTGNDGFGYLASDWQIGKAEGDDGTPQTVARVKTSVDQAVARIRWLRRAGHAMPIGLFAGLGDLLEGTCGWYPGQQFLIDRNRREQNRIVRELITYAILEMAPLFETFIVATVGGNHGENRQDGKRATNDADNDDVAQFEAVREAFDMAPEWGDQLQWLIPQDELSIGLNIQDVGIGLTHGHNFRKGSTVQAKAHEWWKGQVFGEQAVREAQILCSAHFHHFSAVTYGRRTHIQTPAMDPGSKWHSNATGEDAPPGVVTFRIDPSHAFGYDDLKILDPRS